MILLLLFLEAYTGRGFAGQASGTGFMAGICSSTVNLLSVKWRKAAFLLNDRSQYGATGTNLSYEVFTAG